MENSIEKELEEHVQQLINSELENSEKPSTSEYLDKKTVTCKECRRTEEWTSKGKFPNGCKKWRDPRNLICNGRLCGECNRNRAGKTMKRIRANG